MIFRRNSCLFFYSFMHLLVFLCNTDISNGANNITAGQSLSGNQTIISEGGIYELGFFSPGDGTSGNYYLGIWYKKVSIKTAVWIAQETYIDHPIKDIYSSEFKFAEDGCRVILDENGTRVWSSRAPYTTVLSPIVVLLDNGNLVLRDGMMDVIWQSFDYPRDTLLPGAKLGSTETSMGHTYTFLWSQRSSEDPARGFFYLSTGTYFSNPVLRYKYSTNGKYGIYDEYTYWTWSWNGKSFSLLNYVNFRYVSNNKERYFTYSVHNTSIPTRLVMDFLGRLQLLTWTEKTKTWDSIFPQPTWIDDSERWHSVLTQERLCRPNRWSTIPTHQDNTSSYNCKQVNLDLTSMWQGRCLVRTEELRCLGQGDDIFQVMHNIRLSEIVMHTMDQNINECKETCLSVSSCAAYAYKNSCSIWLGDLRFLELVSPDDNRGHTLYVRVAGPRGEKIRRVYIVVVVVGTISVLGVVVVTWKCRRRKLGITPVVDSLVLFNFRDLQRATKIFSDELGRGSFGPVFKGTLPDSSAIAVKKLVCFAGEKQFRAEVNTIGIIQHRNLIRLRGFCAEGRKRMLVYDYMPHGSLASYLFSRDSKILDWNTRYQITLGIARGLAYLHERCRDCIIHCDIKPENILLDASLNAVVADFGMAKLLGRDFSRVLTTMRGTRGYLAPEWLSGVAITPKADAYSYGMMVFEIISGRRNLDMADNDMADYFPARAANKANKGEEVLSLLDPKLEGIAETEELMRVCRIACWCVQTDEKDRPSMGHIVQVLEGVSEVVPPPIPSFLQVLLRDQTTTGEPHSSDQSPGEWSHTSTSFEDQSTKSFSNGGLPY